MLNTNDLIKHAKRILDLTPDGWERTIYFDASKLMEESGEVAECLNKSSKTNEDLADELADVITVAVIIAVKKNIDLNRALINKQKRQLRKIMDRFYRGEKLNP